MKNAYIEIDKERCKACGLCISACPQGIIRFSSEFNSKGYHPAEPNDPEAKCTGCGFCYMMCPDVCITVYRAVKV
ncbi:MAG TPA: 4Fe-4S dicluster domain-containing protein [Kosmotoga arenicorallina]|uniref:4Fe-4S dicluster domain-containing protein n=1 Tax=Kosmotoga arenicorallina TaxID=688066 RepID=A0A7C5HSA3_9BACT|nr:4Fe-4S binding protein [Thermotogaceae bacterium]RKX35811.1 MAG: tungsten formylmethanofuran dehydrogenase [Thermotogota bacterium]RKX38100.1 MAG: tungsten formylmethanofuran dehydrogenase [Thermotogota bacterium]RKX42515.1 MAG: tungsten formylmethanofuran dehydrogenase [Thermotogota bacterium]HHF08687.1 4Fe-4S dicluster domain-containing protein [Kosmotoga arenicorallina]